MATHQDVINYIEAFKKTAVNLEDRTDDIKFFYILSKAAKKIAHAIEDVHSGYYIGVIECGPIDCFYRTYYPLGFMTVTEANENLNKVLNDKELRNEYYEYDSYVKEVSKEEFDIFKKLQKQQIIYDTVDNYRLSIHDIYPKEFMEKLEHQIYELRVKAGIKYSWEDISVDY